MQWVLAPEPSPSQRCLRLVEDLLICREYVEAENKKTWLQTALAVTPTEIESTAEATSGQRDNPQWCSARKLRITASNFGVVIAAAKKGK